MAPRGFNVSDQPNFNTHHHVWRAGDTPPQGLKRKQMDSWRIANATDPIGRLSCVCVWFWPDGHRDRAITSHHSIFGFTKITIANQTSLKHFTFSRLSEEGPTVHCLGSLSRCHNEAIKEGSILLSEQLGCRWDGNCCTTYFVVTNLVQKCIWKISINLGHIIIWNKAKTQVPLIIKSTLYTY